MGKSYTKIIIKNNVRIYVSDYQKIAQDILEIHKYTPLASLILANGISTFGVLGFLYDIEKISILLKTTGAIKTFVLEFKNGQMRSLLGDGTITTEYDDNGLYNDIPLILGIGDEGLIRVSRFINGSPYTSEVPLANADMITDLVYYLNKSDQVFSAIINDVWLNEKNHLKVDRAKSILFQLMPNHTNEDIIWIENLIKNHNLKDIEINEYIKIIDGKELKHQDVLAKCSCNSQKMLDAINLLSTTDREELVDETQDIEVRCDFCLNSIKIEKDRIK